MSDRGKDLVFYAVAGALGIGLASGCAWVLERAAHKGNLKANADVRSSWAQESTAKAAWVLVAVERERVAVERARLRAERRLAEIESARLLAETSGAK